MDKFLYIVSSFCIGTCLFCSCALLRLGMPVASPCKITTVCIGASLSGRWIVITVCCMCLAAAIGFFCGRKLVKL